MSTTTNKILAAVREVLTNDQLEDIAKRVNWTVMEIVEFFEVLEEEEILGEED